MGWAAVRPRIVSVVAGLLLICGSLDAASQSLSGYPALVPDFAQWDKFPAECAGYKRGRIIAYAPAMADFSIAYDRRDADLQNAVTLYFYPRMKDSQAQLRAEEDEVMRVHRGGRVVDRRSISIDHQGTGTDATLITFEFTDVFAGRLQAVASQLWGGIPGLGHIQGAQHVAGGSACLVGGGGATTSPVRRVVAQYPD